jgi:non-ribosomal peptide synthetase component F/acyl carrier protein
VVKNTNYIDLTLQDRVLQLSNYAFDGSMFDIYGALLNGAVLVMIKKESILSVDKLSQTIARELITVFFVTTALFNALTDLNIRCLSQIRKILFGGERISVEHSKKALEHLGKDKINHVYGPTETTVYATYYPINRIDETRDTIPIGSPISDTTTYIVDRYDQLVSIGVHGELLIGGDGIARGYLNKPELTNEKFVRDTITPGERLYRSGDMVRWLGDGSIEFIGRVDHQVKIRGFRIELSEIEYYLLKHSDIKEAIVIVNKDENEDKYLCAYIVSDGEPSISQLRNYLSKNLPGYMIPSYFVPLETLPLTPNGKVDLEALPKPDKEELTGIYIAPQNLVEKKLAEIWSEVLGIKTDIISTESNFFQLGGHSLKATILAFKIHQALNVKVPLAELFKNPTIRELGEYVTALTEEKFIAIKPVEEKEYYELSSTQKRLYVIQQIQLDNTAYNIPMLSVLEGKWERKRLEKTFRKLIHRHKSFRTSFEMVDEKPVQRIHDDVEFVIEYDQSLVNGHRSLVNCQVKGEVPSSIKIEKITRNFIRPFDLSQAPLFRVGLIKLMHPPSALRGRPFPGGQEGKYLLMVDMHHIITDGTSMYLSIKDLIALYEGAELEPIRIQYKDYSEWQSSEMQQQAIRKQREYWLKQFETGIPVLRLPLDCPRPSVQSFEGNTIGFELSPQLTRSLNHLAAENEATLFIVLLGIYNILLFKVSGQEDIVVGTSVAGRRHADLEHITGMLVNNLALRNFPGPGKTFITFLKEVKERTLEAFENQDYQFEDLVESVAVNRDTGRNPLFDTLLSLQNMAADTTKPSPGEIASLRIKPYEIEHRTAKFDLQLACIESEETIYCAYEYCTKLFRKDTIEQFIIYFKKLVLDITHNPRKKISEIEIISEEEKKRILERVDPANLDYQGTRLLLTSKFMKQRAYWLKRLSPDMEKAEPFLNAKREKEKAEEELDIVEILIPAQLFNRLVKLGKQSDLSLYLILLTALKVLIYRYTTHEDVIVISPVYKRNISRETLNQQLFIRDRITGELTFADLLLEIRKSVLEAYENQDYPSSKLIEYLQGSPGLKTDSAEGDIACLLSNIHDTKGFEKPGSGLIFSFHKEESLLKGHILYDRVLYEKEYMQLISKHLVNILDNSTKAIKAKILEISFLSKEEKKRFLIDFNRTSAQYPEEKTLVELFEEQVKRTPGQIALVSQSENEKSAALSAARSAITYREFNEKSNQLAHRLRAKGVKADTIVGIMAERSLPMVIGVMAILKAGGAFLPIDIEYPVPRQKFILEDSEAALLLTQAHLLEKDKENMKKYPCRDIVSIDSDEQEPPSGRYDTPRIIHHPLNLAYVIYTSGTSGKPKGVMIPHRALVNYTWWAAQHYVKEDTVHFPLYTSISFDLTMTSIFTPLITGNAIVIYRKEEEPLLIGRVIADDKVGVIKCTPSHLTLKLTREKFPHIKTVMGGGIFSQELDINSGNLKYLLEKTPYRNYIDKIIVGEGEILFLKYLQQELPQSQKVNSLKDINHRILDLTSAATPDFSDLETRHYSHMAAYTSRSCPFQCNFCAETTYWGKYRKKSAKQIVKELQMLAKKYNHRLFSLVSNPKPLNCSIFSSNVIRDNKSSTRSSTGRFASLYFTKSSFFTQEINSNSGKII